MTIDEAYSKIENCHGFDDTTSAVGEAWERVKDEIVSLQSQLNELEAEVKLRGNQIKGYMGIEARLRNQLVASLERIRVLETLLTADVHAENVAISDELELALERERILREGITQYADRRNWTAANARSKRKDSWVPGIFGYDIAEATIKAAKEVKG